MQNVYIEARPKGRPEGSAVEDFVVEDHADHVLADFKTQGEAIEWARKNNHSPLVARVRHLNDEKSPGHWRRVALRNRFPFQAVPLVRPERTPPCYLSHPIPSRRSLTRRTPPSPRVFAMSRTRVPAYAARKPGPVLLTRVDRSLEMPLRGWPRSGDGTRRERTQAVPLPPALPRST